MNNARRRSRFVLSTLFVLLLAAAAVETTGNAVPREVVATTVPATVKVYALNNDLVPIGKGSGSIVVQSGQVLTNQHVVGDPRTGKLSHDDGIVLISTTSDPRKPPNPAYLGKVIRSDAKMDLAVVTVVSDISGQALDGCLTLPTYTVGDSDELRIGEEIAVIGFPGIGGNSVTYTTGTISGFEEAAKWIKTDTEISPGNSGGSAIDTDGKLIGVPTQMKTTGDSKMQGKIGLIRPIDAAGEILADVGRLGVPGCGGGSSLGPVPKAGGYGPNLVGFVGYTLAAGANQPVRNAPSGSTELYAHFAYFAMHADTPLRYEWLFNGQPTPGSEISDVWPFESGDGSFTLSVTNASGFPDGRYAVRVTAGDRTFTSPEITVGGTGASEGATASVSVRGRVRSADTGRPLAGALFVVLAPGINWENIDFDNPDHTLDVARTNSSGDYQSNMPFPTDQRYSVGVLAEGHRPALYVDVDFAELEPAGGGFVDAGTFELKAN